MNFCSTCYVPIEECEVSAKSFYCPKCKTKFGLNYQYHIAFILVPVALGFLYCLARTMW